MEGLSPKLSPPSFPDVAWALCPTSQWDNAVYSPMGALRAKKMQCGRAGVDGLRNLQGL